MAQTSERVSSIAARLSRITQRDISEIVRDTASNRLPELVQDIRSLAASALRQDETKGLRSRLKKLLGRE